MCVCACVCVFISPFSSNLSSLLARCPPGPRAFQKSLSKNFMRRESFSSSCVFPRRFCFVRSIHLHPKCDGLYRDALLPFRLPGRVPPKSKGYRLMTNPKCFRNPNTSFSSSKRREREREKRAKGAREYINARDDSTRERERETIKKCCVNASSDRSKTPSLHRLHHHHLLHYLLDNNSLAKLAKDRTPVPVLPGVTSPKARKCTRTDTCSGKPRRKKGLDASERAGNCRIF